MDPSFDQEVFENQEHLGSPGTPNVFKNILKWVSGLHLVTETELEEAGVFIGSRQDLEDRP